MCSTINQRVSVLLHCPHEYNYRDKQFGYPIEINELNIFYLMPTLVWLC